MIIAKQVCTTKGGYTYSKVSIIIYSLILYPGTRTPMPPMSELSHPFDSQSCAMQTGK